MKINLLLAILTILVLSLFLSGCAVTKVADLKTDDMVGKSVSVKGVVKTTFKLGTLSGYIMTLEDGEIGVASKSLPAEGKEITVSGTIMKDTLFGFYINAKE